MSSHTSDENPSIPYSGDTGESNADIDMDARESSVDLDIDAPSMRHLAATMESIPLRDLPDEIIALAEARAEWVPLYSGAAVTVTPSVPSAGTFQQTSTPAEPDDDDDDVDLADDEEEDMEATEPRGSRSTFINA